MAVAVPTPPPPGTLDPTGAAKWRDLVPILQGRGNVSAGDLTALECLFAAWQLWRAAQAQIADGGLVGRQGKPVSRHCSKGTGCRSAMGCRTAADAEKPQARRLEPAFDFDEGG